MLRPAFLVVVALSVFAAVALAAQCEKADIPVPLFAWSSQYVLSCLLGALGVVVPLLTLVGMALDIASAVAAVAAVARSSLNALPHTQRELERGLQGLVYPLSGEVCWRHCSVAVVRGWRSSDLSS